MKIKKYIMLFAVVMAGIFSVSAQNRPGTMGPDPSAMLYQQVNQVREAFGLDHNQYDKVYKAYEKYDKAVRNAMGLPGREPVSNAMRPGSKAPAGAGRPGAGAPGMGAGQPNVGRPGSDGLGRPGAGAFPMDKAPVKVDMAKVEKVKAKEEVKLQKSMKKILKTQSNYDRWLRMRNDQLRQTPGFPSGGPQSITRPGSNNHR